MCMKHLVLHKMSQQEYETKYFPDIHRKKHFRMIVYLRTQNLSFVAPIPEQIGTTTMHFPEVSGGT